MTKRVMLQKPNKIDYTVVKSDRVISFVNCLGKVYKRVAANILIDSGEVHHILCEGQIGS